MSRLINFEKNMENKSTVGQQFKLLSILHIALSAGVLIFLFISRFLVKQNMANVPEKNQTIEIAGIAIAFICVLLARFLFFNKTKAALSVSDLGEKINIFRIAFILQMALLEAPALLNIILYFLTKNDLHFFIGLGILLLMIFRRPTRAIAAMVLFNSMEEKEQIYDDTRELKLLR